MTALRKVHLKGTKRKKEGLLDCYEQVFPASYPEKPTLAKKARVAHPKTLLERLNQRSTKTESSALNPPKLNILNPELRLLLRNSK